MQKCQFNSTEITLLYGYSSVTMQHICSRTPFLENASGELLLYTVFIIEVINLEVLHKQVKYQAGKKTCLNLNVIFARSEAAIVVDKTLKRSGVNMHLCYLNCNLCAGRHTSLVAQQHLGRTYIVYIGLGIQRVEAILHVGLYQPFLKEIKEIYSSVTKNVKQSPIFAAQASFVLVLGRLILVLSSCVVLYSCCVMLAGVSSFCYSCCVVLCRVVHVLCRVGSCRYSCSFLDQIVSCDYVSTIKQSLIFNL